MSREKIVKVLKTYSSIFDVLSTQLSRKLSHDEAKICTEIHRFLLDLEDAFKIGEAHGPSLDQKLSREDWKSLDSTLAKHGFGGYYDLVESLKTVLERVGNGKLKKDWQEQVKDLPTVVSLLLKVTVQTERRVGQGVAAAGFQPPSHHIPKEAEEAFSPASSSHEPPKTLPGMRL